MLSPARPSEMGIYIAPWKDLKRFEWDWTDPGTDGLLDHRQAGANNLNILSLRGYLPVLT